MIFRIVTSLVRSQTSFEFEAVADLGFLEQVEQEVVDFQLRFLEKV